MGQRGDSALARFSLHQVLSPLVVFRGVEVGEEELVGIEGLPLLGMEKVDVDFGEKGAYAEVAAIQGLFDGRPTGAGVNCAHGLEAIGTAGDDSLVRSQFLEQKAQEGGGDKGQVAGQEEDGGRRGQGQRGVEAAERTRVRAQIRVDGQLEMGEGVGIVGDQHAVGIQGSYGG